MMRYFLLHVTRLRMYRLELLCVHVCIFFAFVVRGCDILTRLAARQESNNIYIFIFIHIFFLKKHAITDVHTRGCTSTVEKCVYSRSMLRTWRCWTAGRTPGRCAVRGSRCWRGWPGPATGPRRWSWAGSRARGWARRTRRRSLSCRGWRRWRGSPGSPCCCSTSCIGTGREKQATR